MQIVVLTNDSLKKELLNGVSSSIEEVIWVETLSQLQQHKNADVFVDLLFENNHTAVLQNLLPRLVVINSVEARLCDTNPSFVRINGWPSFLKSSLIEASSLNGDSKKKAERLFYFFNKKLEWLPDEVGFVTPRVISMIVNEAFIALKEDVSTKNEIDTAMKLGTNYPYGPFEWCEKIGREKIRSLLQQLSKEKPHYSPSGLLFK